jgi:hypothetical protein
MLLVDLRELLPGEAPLQPDECRPQPSVHQSHFAFDEAAHQQVP